VWRPAALQHSSPGSKIAGTLQVTDPDGSATPPTCPGQLHKDVPAQLVSVSALTRENIKSTVIADDFYTVDQICTAKYKAACAAIGLQ
jgi:hypothetical protein